VRSHLSFSVKADGQFDQGVGAVHLEQSQQELGEQAGPSTMLWQMFRPYRFQFTPPGR